MECIATFIKFNGTPHEINTSIKSGEICGEIKAIRGFHELLTHIIPYSKIEKKIMNHWFGLLS